METFLSVKIKKVTLLITSSTDRIMITLDEETAFPEMKYPPHLVMEARHGYGLEYCRRVLKLEPEVIKEGGGYGN